MAMRAGARTADASKCAIALCFVKLAVSPRPEAAPAAPKSRGGRVAREMGVENGRNRQRRRRRRRSRLSSSRKSRLSPRTFERPSPRRVAHAPHQDVRRLRADSEAIRQGVRIGRISLQDAPDREGLSAAHGAPPGGAPEGAELGEGDRPAHRRAVRGARRGRQGRHDQALHGASQSARRARRRAGEAVRARAHASGISSATSSICRRPARSFSSTAPGTTAPASSG